MKCPECHASNDVQQKFCGNCGASLDPALEAVRDFLALRLETEIESALDKKTKNQDVVEIETAEKVVTRITSWAKLFGFVVGIPAAIILVVLGFFGVKTISDISRMAKDAETAINNAKDTVITTADDLAEEQKQIAEDQGKLKDKLKEVDKEINGFRDYIAERRADELLAGDSEAFRRAEETIAAGLRDTPEDVTLLNEQGYLHKNRAIEYRRLGKEDEAKEQLAQAEKAFKKVLDNDEKNASALNGLGSVSILQGDVDRAEEYVRKALTNTPDYQAAQHDLRLIQELKRRTQPD